MNANYWYVSVYRGEEHVGYVRRDGSFVSRSCWANDCKFTNRTGAENAKIIHVIAAAREHVGHFPFSYVVAYG